MQPDRLPPAEGRILVEQLKLVLSSIRSSVLPTVFLVAVLAATLYNNGNALPLTVWAVWMISSKLYVSYDARHTLTSDVPVERTPLLLRRLIAFHGVNGASWGALPWITLDTVSTGGSILMFSALAGVVGGTMALLSPVPVVYLAFCVSIVIVMVSKLFLTGDPFYFMLGVCSMLYLASVVSQGRNSGRVARSMIELRFENLQLIENLQLEVGHAKDARRDAEQANLAKSKFLAAASHDLRQPIHAQGLFLEMLARTGLSSSQREILASASAANEASADMLNTLLDFSRIEAGVVAPQMRPFRLQPLLNKIESELAPQADAKGLVYRSRETFAAVQSDPALVEMILRNLVLNAIRYTERGGVLVACRARGDVILLEVWDTGIGIEQSQQQDIFREFHQLGNPERDRQKGLGLGLAIVDGLARALQHDVSIGSTPQRGSVFRLALPVTHVAMASDVHDSLQAAPRALDARVLIIDDDDAVRAGMRQLLVEWGCTCAAAGSIEEALVLARLHRPDLVISDYRLREQRTGAEAIAALRAECGIHLPAVLITGDTAPERLREALATGVPLLHKPVSPRQLHRALVSVLDDVANGAQARANTGQLPTGTT